MGQSKSKLPGDGTARSAKLKKEKKGSKKETAGSDSSSRRRSLMGRKQKSRPKSGFHSDIQAEAHESVASHLAHKNLRKFDDVYELPDGTPILGTGACGVVCVVKRKDTGELYAMKSVNVAGMDDLSISDLRREIDIQRTLAHPNICRLFESFEEGGEMRIIMEICTGGALVSRMKKHRHG